MSEIPPPHPSVPAPGVPEPKSFAAEVIETVKTLVIALLIALVLRVVLFQPNTIPSASMEPNLLIGDYILVTKFDYGWSRHSIPFTPPLPQGRFQGKPVERGDVVVFHLPRDISETYVKRIIGLPGDRIQVRGGLVYVNEVAIPRVAAGETQDPDSPDVTVGRYWETYGKHRYLTFDRSTDHPGDNTEVFIVPEAHYFAMGDNRDNSLDSRWPPAELGVGFVPEDNILGKVRMVLVSWTGGASLFKPWTWVTRFDPGRMFRSVD